MNLAYPEVGTYILNSSVGRASDPHSDGLRFKSELSGQKVRVSSKPDGSGKGKRILVDGYWIYPAFGNWFAGFWDGEGYFQLRRLVDKRDGRIHYYPCARIGQRIDDGEVVRYIADSLHFGKVRFVDNSSKRARGANTNDTVE